MNNQEDHIINMQNSKSNEAAPDNNLIIDGSLKVSVIIPIYNVEQYIEECISSVMNQTLKDIEIICVNDGTLDRSMEIVRQFKEIDNRIIILDKENGGLSSARNAGMKVAKGEFILFLDSDDYLVENALDCLYSQAKYNQLDQLFYNADVFYESKNALKEFPNYLNYYIRNSSYENNMSGKNLFIQFQKNKDFKPSACLQLLNRDFLERNKIEFFEGILHEDQLFTLQCISLAERTKFIDAPLYMRRVRDESIMTTKKGWENAYGYYVSVRELVKFIGVHRFQRHEEFLETLLVRISDMCLYATSFLENIETDEVLANIRNLELEDRIQFSLWIYSINNCEKKRKILKSKVKSLNAKLDEEKKKTESLKHSKTYRIGRIITWLPGKILNKH